MLSLSRLTILEDDFETLTNQAKKLGHTTIKVRDGKRR